MNARRLISALCVALVISGLFTWLLSRHFARTHAPATQLTYVVAGKALDAGEILTAADLKQDTWSGPALAGTFQRPENAVGRTLLYPIAAGQPILDRQISPLGSGTGLSTRIPEGMRAISLKSDQVVGVAGYLLPGTHVDVLVTLTPNNAQDAAVTSTVLQDAQILTAGQKMQPDPDGKASTVDVVTLLVSPADAEKVALASAQGRVHFILRNGADHSISDHPPTQLASLAARDLPKAVEPRTVTVTRRAPAAAPAPERYHVDVTRGEKQTVETF